MPKKKTRPDVIDSKTYGMATSCGKLFLRVGYEEGKITEVFAQLGKSGCCQRGFLEGISYLLSDILKYEDIDDEDRIEMIKHLLSVNCPQPFMWKGEKYTSCEDLIAKTILNLLGSQDKK